VSVVVLYGRPGCCLCDEARAVLERVRAQQPFELIERDIERDEGLLRAYLERIPVVTLDGEELFDFAVDETVLREWLGKVPRMTDDPSAFADGSLRRAPSACRSASQPASRATSRF
jgi:glutaredoxin